jgi:hypothetical protein
MESAPKKRYKNMLLLLLAVILICGAGITLFLGLKSRTNNPTVTREEKPWKTFTSTSFSVQYPPDWYAKSIEGQTDAVYISDVANPENIPNSIPPKNHQIIFIGYYQGDMPTAFPYKQGDTNSNTTIQSYTINGYTGIEGHTAPQLDTNDVDNINIPDGKGGYLATSNYLGDISMYKKILLTFKFINR